MYIVYPSSLTILIPPLPPGYLPSFRRNSLEPGPPPHHHHHHRPNYFSSVLIYTPTILPTFPPTFLPTSLPTFLTTPSDRTILHSWSRRQIGVGRTRTNLHYNQINSCNRNWALLIYRRRSLSLSLSILIFVYIYLYVCLSHNHSLTIYKYSLVHTLSLSLSFSLFSLLFFLTISL